MKVLPREMFSHIALFLDPKSLASLFTVSETSRFTSDERVAIWDHVGRFSTEVACSGCAKTPIGTGARLALSHATQCPHCCVAVRRVELFYHSQKCRSARCYWLVNHGQRFVLCENECNVCGRKYFADVSISVLNAARPSIPDDFVHKNKTYQGKNSRRKAAKRARDAKAAKMLLNADARQ